MQDEQNLPIPRLNCLLVTIFFSWSLFSFLVVKPVKISCFLTIMTPQKSILNKGVYDNKCNKKVRALLVDSPVLEL